MEAAQKPIGAVLDLSGLAVGEHNVNLQIQVNARPVEVISASPQSVTFGLEPLATQTLNVDLRLTGEAAIGYQVGDAVLEPLRAVVAGAQSQIQKVRRARVSVGFDGIRESLSPTS